MDSDWLTVSSFERSIDIISAINTISAHTKFLLAGINDPTPQNHINAAQAKLVSFLRMFQVLLGELDTDQREAVLGADPRMAELIQRYLALQRTQNSSDRLYSLPIDDVIQLLNLDNLDRLPEVVAYLGELRILIEQHSQTDVTRMLGKL